MNQDLLLCCSLFRSSLLQFAELVEDALHVFKKRCVMLGACDSPMMPLSLLSSVDVGLVMEP